MIFTGTSANDGSNGFMFGKATLEGVTEIEVTNPYDIVCIIENRNVKCILSGEQGDNVRTYLLGGEINNEFTIMSNSGYQEIVTSNEFRELGEITNNVVTGQAYTITKGFEILIGYGNDMDILTPIGDVTLYGDLDFDGVIGPGDIYIIELLIANSEYDEIGDMDMDGDVDNDDLIIIEEIVAREILGDSIPAGNYYAMCYKINSDEIGISMNNFVCLGGLNELFEEDEIITPSGGGGGGGSVGGDLVVGYCGDGICQEPPEIFEKCPSDCFTQLEKEPFPWWLIFLIIAIAVYIYKKRKK